MPHRQASFFEPRVLFPFLLITLIWGSTWLVIRDQLGTVPAGWSVTYRFIIAAVAVVFALLLVPNSALGWLFLKHKMTGRFLLGSAIAMAGVALLFVQELRHSEVPTNDILLGIGVTLLAVLAASVSNVMQASERLRHRPVAAMLAWGMFYGLLFDAAFAWFLHGPPVVEARWGYWLGLVYLGLFASALAFTIYFRLIRLIGPARSAYSSLLVPVIAMALSTVFEGYRWSTLAAAGGVLALIGLVIALRSNRPQVAAVEA
jgi:drug/metabolite transporter (DMT)-like permease